MKKFSGVITALVTPFFENEVDYHSLERLVQDQIHRGIQGFVINGTTGESPTLTSQERREIFAFIKKQTPSGFPLLMGTGSNSTARTVELSREVEKLGADGILVVVPYYNKPPQRGLLEHFKVVADSVSIPTILYNVPGRTVAGLDLETIKKLSEHPQIIGIKEATGNVEFAKKIREACGQEFLLLSGDDGTYVEFMKRARGDGVISVASHLIPEAMLKKETSVFSDLIDALFVEANPIPVKMALHLLGVLKSPGLRLPLVELHSAAKEKLRDVMAVRGLL